MAFHKFINTRTSKTSVFTDTGKAGIAKDKTLAKQLKYVGECNEDGSPLDGSPETPAAKTPAAKAAAAKAAAAKGKAKADVKTFEQIANDKGKDELVAMLIAAKVEFDETADKDVLIAMLKTEYDGDVTKLV